MYGGSSPVFSRQGPMPNFPVRQFFRRDLPKYNFVKHAENNAYKDKLLTMKIIVMKHPLQEKLMKFNSRT